MNRVGTAGRTMLPVKRRDLPIDPGPIDLGRQAHQLMLGVDDLIEPGPEQIVRLRRLALLGSHSNFRSAANHSSCWPTTAKNEIARFRHLMARTLRFQNRAQRRFRLPFKRLRDLFTGAQLASTSPAAPFAAPRRRRRAPT